MSRKIMKKILSVSLCALMLGGTAVTLPASVSGGVTGITANAANDETPASSFEYILNYYYYQDEDGIAITEFKGSETSVVIPSEIDGFKVTRINGQAFRNCTNITSVTIPDSVKFIGSAAFKGCTGLTSVTIGNGVTSIEENAFEGCTGLTSIVIPDSVTSIGNSAFYGCTGLTSVSILKGVESIDYRAFCGCTGIKSITIPDSVTSIGSSAFYGCTGLTSVTIGNSVTSIGSCAFSDCTKLTSITIPDSVTNIGEEAFNNTPWDNSLPDGLVYAGKVAYKYNGEMPSGTKIVLKNGTKGIAGNLFSDCTGLTSITIPDSVISIGDSAFCGCTRLKSLTIPDSVTSIGSSAFSGCTGLTSIVIPGSVTSIGWYTFRDCTGLTSISIPDSVTSIGAYLLVGCTGIKNAYISNNITVYPEGLFSGCTGLTSVTILDSVTGISMYAFEGCTGLTSITIPNSVKIIGYHAFKNCTNLKSIKLPDYLYYFIGNDTFRNCKSLTSITIPYGPYSIGEGAFYGCTGLTNVKISDDIGRIEGYAFFNCTGLKSISIPNSVTGIKEKALGYYYDDDGNEVKIDDFVIYGTKNSAAETYANDNGFTFKVEALKNTSTIDSDSVEISDYVYFDAKATGGAAPYTFTYRCKKTDATSWKYLAVNTTDETLSYKPASEGTYDIQVIVKDADGKTVTKGFKLNVTTPLANNSTISATSTTVGTAVKLTAKATGGKTPYTYTYRTKVSTSSKWTYLATNIKSTTFSFTPSKVATYDVQVIVKDADGKTVTKGFKLTVKAAFTNTSTISATSTTAGKAVTLTAKAAGGKTPYTYTFRCKKTDATSWKYLAANTTTATLNYKPASAGTYDVQVIVKDAEGKTVTKGFKLTVKDAFTNTSTISATSTTAGKAVTLTAKATGGKTPYTYTFRCKKTDATSWKYLATNTTTATLNYKPASTGTYDVQVIVKDADGKTVTKGFKLTVK